MRGASKLNSEKVLAIRKELAAGTKQLAIAVQFGVSTRTISAIKTGKMWAQQLAMVNAVNRCNNFGGTSVVASASCLVRTAQNKGDQCEMGIQPKLARATNCL